MLRKLKGFGTGIGGAELKIQLRFIMPCMMNIGCAYRIKNI